MGSQMVVLSELNNGGADGGRGVYEKMSEKGEQVK